LEKALNEAKKSEAQLRQIIDTIPALAWCNLADGSNEFLNQRWLDYTGLSQQEACGWGWKVTIHPEDLGKLTDKWRALLVSGEPGEIEARLRRYDGEYRWFLFRVEPWRDDQGNVIRWYGTNTDIEDRKRAEALLAAEKRTLEMIAHGAGVADILESLCVTIDAQAPNIISAVMLMDADGMRLWPVARPRLPKGWIETITPLKIGPGIGSCGSAAFLKQRVIVSDIATDPLWVDYRDAALSYGFRAAWSQPLLSKSQQVLGTFGMYYAEPRTPSEADLRLIEGAGHVAVIAIEGERSQAALTRAFDEIAKSEAELRTIVDAVPQAINVMDPEGKVLYANKGVLEYTGLSAEDVSAEDFRARIFHPDDFRSIEEERKRLLAADLPFEIEQRARRKDGQFRWFLIRYNPLRDDQGHVVRWYATGTDIDDRKRSEERMRNENRALREDIDRSSMFEGIVGSSEPLRRVLSQVAKVAPADSTVLILGETGTGKELIARAIHQRSKRSDRAFIRVNCAVIPPSLIASELFGHEKGAFTGAQQRRVGRFESADGGTIFLDEVGELPPATQVALLRVLQEREFERVGGSQTVSVDVRVLAATNEDLSAAVAEGKFRRDLFYRLNVVPIRLPPLRERVDDIPVLVEYLIARYAKRAGKRIRSITASTLKLFQAYDWPGNIRELQNIVERAVILCDEETFCVDEAWLTRADPKSGMVSVPLVADLVEHERAMIENALRDSGGVISGAAAKLSIPRQTLDSKIRKLGIDRHRFKTS